MPVRLFQSFDLSLTDFFLSFFSNNLIFLIIGTSKEDTFCNKRYLEWHYHVPQQFHLYVIYYISIKHDVTNFAIAGNKNGISCSFNCFPSMVNNGLGTRLAATCMWYFKSNVSTNNQWDQLFSEILAWPGLADQKFNINFQDQHFGDPPSYAVKNPPPPLSDAFSFSPSVSELAYSVLCP